MAKNCWVFGDLINLPKVTIGLMRY